MSGLPAGDGEFALIERHFTRRSRSPDVVLGVGDDGAIVRPTPGHETVYTVDMLVEGRHFLPGTNPERLGHKALAVNLSDLAAMGATPRFALVAGALPDADPQWLAAFARGLFALADAEHVDVIGGDTTRGPRNLCLTLIGEVPAGAALTRAGARDGDDVWVSGSLGDAMLGLAVLEGRTRVASAALAALVARLEAPTPRVALGTALRGIASAAIDVSDGLVGDLGHVAQRSGVRIGVDVGAIPRAAALDAKLGGSERALALQCLVAGGDDYELAFTAPSALRAEVAALAGVVGVPLTRIGDVEAGNGVVLHEHGAPLADVPRAFDHFAG
ncbi:MAG: thiamine-phosphate kinase [Proteobacteria bacterium]|nr:thiamine-phosphate kinase [Pseudomonadota bacterium]